MHYTSAEAALGIIRSKRIWMRNATCMTDYREVQHGYEILNRFFIDPARRERFNQALDSIAPNIASEAVGLFDQWWKNIRLSTYISSISEHREEENLHGRLSMWRAFGGTTARVAIVFRMPWFAGAQSELNVMFSPVAYLREDQVHQEIEAVIRNVDENKVFLQTVDRHLIVATVFNMLTAGVTCLKHHGFDEEREWRVIYGPERRPSALMESSIEVILGVPQIVYKLPLDRERSPTLAALDLSSMFDRLIIGPSQFSWAMHEAFSKALIDIGIADAKERICISGIPIRS